MKVVPMRVKTFKCLAPRATVGMPEGLKLVTGIATTCWMPTLMLCIAVGNLFPILLMLCCEVLGTFLGLLLYALRSPYRIASCVPITRTPNVPAAAMDQRERRAA